MEDEESLEKGKKRGKSNFFQKKSKKVKKSQKKGKKGVDKREAAWYYN